MKTKIISTKGISAIFILCCISVTNFSLSAQNADNLLLKNFRPVSIYKIPVTHVVRAAFPVIDVHSHDYARTDKEAANLFKSITETSFLKSMTVWRQRWAILHSWLSH